VIATSELVKASRVIAIDTNPDKESWARKFGATDFVNPAKLPEGTKIQDYLVEITDGGLDYTFDCTGNVSASHGRMRMMTDPIVGPCYACGAGSLPQRLGY
jgi:S-(hydroxymethyl)glutathione dehydrogenase / alcohol dehydrogenase